MKVSVIIPIGRFNPLAKLCVERCLELEGSDFEIIVCGDDPSRPPDLPEACRYEALAGSVSQKRNHASRLAASPILAYIDADAYPRRDWLSRAAARLRAGGCGAVTGPNLTPPDSDERGKRAGAVLESALALGPFRRNYRADTPEHLARFGSTCNLVLRRSVFLRCGGFDENLLTAEDRRFSKDIREKAGERIAFSPDVVVYHYRRALLVPFLRQWFNYGVRTRHGRRFLSGSERALFFLPALVPPFHLWGLLALLGAAPGARAYLALAALWLACAALDALRNQGREGAFIRGLAAALLPLAVGLGTWAGLLMGGRLWVGSEADGPPLPSPGPKERAGGSAASRPRPAPPAPV